MLTPTATAVVAGMGSELHIEFGCTVLGPLQEVDRKSYTAAGSGQGIMYVCGKQTGKTVFLQEVETTNYILAEVKRKNAGSVVWSGSMDVDKERRTSSANF